MPIVLADTRRNWLRSRRMSSWLPAPPAVVALQQATRTVPIVFANIVDPVGAGFVDSLAQPGGNVTGLIAFEYVISAKWLELLKEIAPQLKRVAVLREPDIASGISWP
jgi:putative ABC transport system substrate-binding protein